MKILHTADIHLRNSEDERWEALQTLIKAGKKEKIDLLIISGDLFDKDVKADILRPKIQSLFTNNGFKIIIIPGNHDQNSYEHGLFFGPETKVLREFGDIFDFQNTRILGIPFEDIQENELAEKLSLLSEKLAPDKKNIIVCHGELLDAFFSRGDFGEEGEKRYMPFRLAHFQELGVDYVLAGHFHTNFDVRETKKGSYFVYPGSPVSITKKEIGRRKANLLIIGQEPRELPLDTFYYEKAEITLDPFGLKSSLELIKEQLPEVPPQAKLIVKISGFFNGQQENLTEEELHQKITQIIPANAELLPEIKDVGIILEDELYKNFAQKVKGLNLSDDEKDELLKLALQAMTQVKSS